MVILDCSSPNSTLVSFWRSREPRVVKYLRNGCESETVPPENVLHYERINLGQNELYVDSSTRITKTRFSFHELMLMEEPKVSGGVLRELLAIRCVKVRLL